MHTAVSRAVGVPWKKLLLALYDISGLILVRSICRIAEYIQGATGRIQSSEWWLFVFDVALIAMAAVIPIFPHH